MTIDRKEYRVLDWMRLFCACMIVILHVIETPSVGKGWIFMRSCFYFQSVPFFFAVSGFFLARKLYADENKIRTAFQYACKQLLLYLAWCVLWLPNLLGIYRSKYPDASLVKMAVLLARRIVLAGEGVYWYVLVLAECAVIIGVLLHFKKEKLLYAFAVLGLILRYFYDFKIELPVISQISYAFYFVFSWSNNFIMMGLPFMALGVFCAKNRATLSPDRRVCIGVYAAATVVHAVLAILKEGTVWADGILFPLQTASLFLIGLGLDTDRITQPQAIAAREISAVIYFMHTVFIYEVFDRFFTVDAPATLKFCGSIGLSLLTYAIVRLTKFKPFYWLLGMHYSSNHAVKKQKEPAA